MKLRGIYGISEKTILQRGYSEDLIAKTQSQGLNILIHFTFMDGSGLPMMVGGFLQFVNMLHLLAPFSNTAVNLY